MLYHVAHLPRITINILHFVLYHTARTAYCLITPVPRTSEHVACRERSLLTPICLRYKLENDEEHTSVLSFFVQLLPVAPTANKN